MNRKRNLVLVGTAAAALLAIPTVSALADTGDNPPPTVSDIAPQSGVLSDSLNEATTLQADVYCEPGAAGATCVPVVP